MPRNKNTHKYGQIANKSPQNSSIYPPTPNPNPNTHPAPRSVKTSCWRFTFQGELINILDVGGGGFSGALPIREVLEAMSQRCFEEADFA